jgi:hypothetical protein
VRVLLPASKFGEHVFVNRLLRGDETLEIKAIRRIAEFVHVFLSSYSLSAQIKSRRARSYRQRI